MNSARVCLQCFEAETDHVGGRCLFASTPFEPHQLLGDAQPAGLWSPVSLFAEVTTTTASPLDVMANEILEHVAVKTGIPLEFLDPRKSR